MREHPGSVAAGHELALRQARMDDFYKLRYAAP